MLPAIITSQPLDSNACVNAVACFLSIERFTLQAAEEDHGTTAHQLSEEMAQYKQRAVTGESPLEEHDLK